jgi:hypothetical protein
MCICWCYQSSNTSVRFTDVPGLSPDSHSSHFENAQILKPQIKPQLLPFIACHIFHTPVICRPLREIPKKKTISSVMLAGRTDFHEILYLKVLPNILRILYFVDRASRRNSG